MNRAAQQPAPRKGELSGDRLLEIAAVLFRDQGYASTTMRDIADAAGMKAGSLYYHFQSKDQILDLVLERGIGEAIENLEAALARLPEDASFAERLTAAVVSYLSTMADFGSYTVANRQLLNNVPEAVRQRHLARRNDLDRFWAALLEDGWRRGDIPRKPSPAIVRLFLLGSLNWATEWIDPSRKPMEELGKIAVDFFLHGLGEP